MSKQKSHNIKRRGMQTLQKQHDTISKSINRVLLVLIGFSLFCVLTLGAEDASLLRTDATIMMPFAGTQISFIAFLIIGPTVLIVLTGYLHVLVGYWNSLGGRQYIGALPQIQNIQAVGAVVVSGYLLYWLTPTVLAVFAWKALPRPEGSWLVLVGSFVTATLAWLQIFRWKTYAKWIKNIWLLVPLAFVTLLIVQAYYQAPFIVRGYYQLKNFFFPAKVELQSVAPDPGAGYSIVDVPPQLFPRRLLERRLQLRGADLSNQFINLISIKNGDLSFANLSKTLFIFTEFTDSNLRGVNLAGSRFGFVWLNNVSLQHANLSGTEFAYVSLSRADLQGANLSGAQFPLSNLHNANLRDADLSDANFRMSEGLTCGQITQAKQWWKAGRPLILLVDVISRRNLLKKGT